MNNEKFSFQTEFGKLLNSIKTLDKKVVIILISVAVLQTISWYYTSRGFFRNNFFNLLQFNPNVYLYEYFYWFFGDFFTYFILGTLIIVLLLREKPKDYGLRFGDYKAGLKIAGLFVIIMIPIIWFVSASKDFSSTYPQLNSARNSWDVFLIFELAIFVYLFAWEFIWRGFLLFGLEKKFGYYAVLIQMIPFVILHNGKPAAETFSAIIGGIALGILALRTRSIFYGVIVHMSVMFSIDFFSTLRYRANEFGVGVSSLIHIIKEIF